MRKIQISGALTVVLCAAIFVSWIKPKAPANWKLGIALWTFHRFTLAESIRKSDSAGVHYIEGSTFQKVGDEIENTSVTQISDQGIVKLNKYLDDHHLQMKSIYVFGGKTIASWKSQFELAKRLKVDFVTGEPQKELWDSIDSLAGVYHIKVAIHNHWKGMSIYWHPDSVLAAIKGHPNFGACPDLGHWPKSGIDAVEGLRKLQGHILAIHLKDADELNNPKANDVNLGKGVVNFKAAFDELKRQKYKGYIYIERDADYRPSNLPSVIEEIGYYNQLTGKL
ncbi:sugar phosphate isomerase/epimerase family protein [Mucilaginibacter sp.]|uniref:sugar phosphate isomerase/epimerase family protein n=1 Tax=Mucilaginibacter sp. TaxID=1882438 RepID=UPI0025F36BF2|nr:sugar phosphate isomerase/epimerase family protein [Mucilaginibacter sp.]